MNVRHCVACDVPLLPRRVWDDPRHAQLRPGHARQGARGLCRACYDKARTRGILQRYEIPTHWTDEPDASDETYRGRWRRDGLVWRPEDGAA